MAADDPSKKYNQDFFLALAAKGKEAWNAWRRNPANKRVCVTFAGISFSKAPRDKIDFSGFEFGDDADFSLCKWRGGKWVEIPDRRAFKPGRASFDGAAFGDKASFARAAFGNRASFAGAAFGDEASFAGAAFGDRASLAGAAFGDEASFVGAAFFGRWASFVGAAFGDQASFAGAAFGAIASFDGAAFGDIAIFAGAAFSWNAGFNRTHFKGRVHFNGTSKEQWSRNNEATADEADEKVKEARIARKQRQENLWKRFGWPDRFLSISFANARFDGEAVFSGRTFEGIADFINARFYYPPDFDTATNAARINFTGAHIGFARPGRLLHWTSETKVPVRLRALRKIAEDTKNHDLERDLYIEERKAERGVYWRQLVEELKKAPEELKKQLEDIVKQKKHVWLEWRLQRRARNAHWLEIAVKIARLAVHGFWIAVMGIYWALADYGRSFARPAAWLVSSGFFFYWCYTEVLAKLMAKAPQGDSVKAQGSS